MKNNKLINTLINIGLSEKEATVYITALSLGPTTVLKISQNSDIKRATTYDIINTLKQKGLISIQIKGWKKLFVATDPEKLNYILEAKKEELENNLPELMALQNLKGGESFIKYYEGLESVKLIYEKLLQEKDDYMVISDQKRFLAMDHKYFSNFIKRRAKAKMYIRLLLQDSKTARDYQKTEKNYSQKIKILPLGTDLTTNLIISPKKIVIHQLTAPIMAMVVENKSMIQLHRELFEMIWKTIKD